MSVGVWCEPLTGELSIQGTSGWVSMHTYAWNLTDLLALWRGGDKGGADRPIANAGSRAYPRRRITTRYSLPLAICGEVDRNGTPYPDPWVGLQTNMAFLQDEIVATPATDAGTRNATLTLPSGVDRSAAVHVLDIIPGRSLQGVNDHSGDAGVLVLATLEIEIPRGTTFR